MLRRQDLVDDIADRKFCKTPGLQHPACQLRSSALNASCHSIVIGSSTASLTASARSPRTITDAASSSMRPSCCHKCGAERLTFRAVCDAIAQHKVRPGPQRPPCMHTNKQVASMTRLHVAFLRA